MPETNVDFSTLAPACIGVSECIFTSNRCPSNGIQAKVTRANTNSSPESWTQHCYDCYESSQSYFVLDHIKQTKQRQTVLRRQNRQTTSSIVKHDQKSTLSCACILLLRIWECFVVELGKQTFQHYWQCSQYHAVHEQAAVTATHSAD